MAQLKMKVRLIVIQQMLEKYISFFLILGGFVFLFFFMFFFFGSIFSFCQTILLKIIFVFYNFVFFFKYIFALGFFGVLKLLLTIIFSFLIEDLESRTQIIYSNFLIDNLLPHDFTIYYQPKFSFFYLNFGYNEENPEMKQGNGIDPIPFLFSLTTTSTFFNLAEFDGFFLFSISVWFVTVISVLLFHPIDYFEISDQGGDDPFVDDFEAELEPNHFLFHDYLSYPKAYSHYVNIQNGLYTADERAPEWLFFIKAYHEDYILNVFDKEYDQVSIYLLMDDIEDEFLALKSGVSDDETIQYDFLFFLRFSFLYPILNLFYIFFDFFFINFFVVVTNASRFFFSIYYKIFYLFFFFSFFITKYWFFFVVCFLVFLYCYLLLFMNEA